MVDFGDGEGDYWICGEREERIRREEMQQKTRRKEKRRTKQNKSYSTHVSSP
jgi:hypothetical protein